LRRKIKYDTIVANLGKAFLDVSLRGAQSLNQMSWNQKNERIKIMKKCMLGLVAATAIFSVVSEASALESSNVVGYQNIVIDTSIRNFIGGTFLPVSSNMTMGDVGVNELFAPITDTIYTINGFGGVDKMYYYVDADTASVFGGTAGWYYDTDIDNWDGESSLSCRNGDTLEIGQMLCVSCGTDGAALVFSGEVSAEDIALSIDTSVRNFLVNCTPSNITMGDITVNELFAPITDTVYTIDGYGGVAKMYYYVDADTASAFGGTAGWYYDTDIDNWDGESAVTCHNDDPIAAGQGLVVSSGTDGSALIIPSAL
jgi:hypothetical protein